MPDSSKWTYDTGGGGWGNSELETYCSPGSNTAPCSSANPNAFMDGNGNLVIRARKDSSGNWTSARMKTQGLYSFQYGRIEARMKLTVGNGLWPAFWMLGNDIGSAGWSQCGDDALWNGSTPMARTRLSRQVTGRDIPAATESAPSIRFRTAAESTTRGYHIYGLIWSANLLQYYRDSPSNVFLTITPSSIPSGDQWVYNAPFFVLLNHAVGGKLVSRA